MNQRREQWLNEKPQFDGGQRLLLRRDDLVIFQFAANGDDGPDLISIYRSHIVPAVSQNGTKFNKQIWCPVQSGATDINCPMCQQGHTDIKERFSMWMWVQYILHAQLPSEKSFPIQFFQGKNYFIEEVNQFKRWDTSAWRESPWADINRLFEIYKGLHNFTAELEAVGDGLTRRYKVIAMPNSPSLAPEIYARAKEECEPIGKMLRAQLNSAVQTAPPVAPTNTVGALVTPFSGVPTTAPAFNPTGSSQPVSTPLVLKPVEESSVSQPAVFVPQGSEENKTEDTPPWEENKEAPQTEDKRPMRGLF